MQFGFYDDQTYSSLSLQCFDTVGWATGKGIRLVKSWVLVCCWSRFDWSLARLTVPVVTTTSIIVSSTKVQNGDILVPANHPEKWPLNGEIGVSRSQLMKLIPLTLKSVEVIAYA